MKIRAWIELLFWILKIATWKTMFYWLMRKPQSQEASESDLMLGLASADECDLTATAGTVGFVPNSMSGSLDAKTEAVRFAISSEKDLWFSFFTSSLRIWKSGGCDVFEEKNVSNDDLDAYVQIMRLAIASSPTLTHIILKFYDDTIDWEDDLPEQFAEAICLNQKFEFVGIECLTKHVTTAMVMKFSQVLLESPKLRKCRFPNILGSQVKLSAIKKFASAICGCQLLTAVTITSHWRDRDGDGALSGTERFKLLLKPFMGGERCNQTVTSLRLEGMKINDEMGMVEGSMLLHITTLQCLMLYCNSIGSKEIPAIAQALAANSTLEEIDITNNSIGADGAIKIVEALCSNTTLRHLGMWGNSIGEEGLKALVESFTLNTPCSDIAANSSLRVLSIGRRSNIEHEGIEYLEALVQENDSLLELHLNYCSILSDANNVIRFLEVLKYNKSLQLVNLFACKGVEGRKVLGTIFDLLQVNHHLENLDIRETPLDVNGGGGNMVRERLKKKAEDKIGKLIQSMAKTMPVYARIFLCGYPFADMGLNLLKEIKVILNFCPNLLLPQWKDNDFAFATLSKWVFQRDCMNALVT